MSGPRLALVLLQYYMHRKLSSSLPGVVMLACVLRMFSCGGWVYITSTDDHDAHDVLMISYIVLNLPWMFGTLACTPVQHAYVRRKRYALMRVSAYTSTNNAQAFHGHDVRGTLPVSSLRTDRIQDSSHP